MTKSNLKNMALNYHFDIDKRSVITLSKSTIENIMQHIDKVDKNYLKQIHDTTLIHPNAQELKQIFGMKRIVLGAFADLLLEFLPKE